MTSLSINVVERSLLFQHLIHMDFVFNAIFSCLRPPRLCLHHLMTASLRQIGTCQHDPVGLIWKVLERKYWSYGIRELPGVWSLFSGHAGAQRSIGCVSLYRAIALLPLPQVVCSRPLTSTWGPPLTHHRLTAVTENCANWAPGSPCIYTGLGRGNTPFNLACLGSDGVQRKQKKNEIEKCPQVAHSDNSWLLPCQYKAQ